ncbi:MAG: FG-GAP-like repeat-containing protein [Myxococcales bacterium]|nr:FG-GAP-like repeat-containing protein [Myxococcales bacterium]MDD9966793.1 FG-GAP-like repeat-containing protein [Myxococcales bacterium]
MWRAMCLTLCALVSACLGGDMDDADAKEAAAAAGEDDTRNDARDPQRDTATEGQDGETTGPPEGTTPGDDGEEGQQDDPERAGEPANQPDEDPAQDDGSQEAGDEAMQGEVDPMDLGPQLSVVRVEPTARGISAPVDGPIVIHFDRPVDRSSVTPESLWAFGRWSGPVRDGEYTFSDDDRTVSLSSPRKWSCGDRVTVVLSRALTAADGTNLRDEGFSFQFITATKAAPMAFTEIERQTTRSSASAPTRSYGGSAADLDGDGYLDLMIVNEDSLDLRIFMNKGDGSGTFHPFTQKPIVALDQRASPSETTDFNGDGKVDLVTANLDANNLSILFGNGDGTFTESQKIRVGEEPRGVAVIDADGDGDIDIVNTNANSDNMSLLLNDGTGQFPEDEGPDFVFWDAAQGQATATREFGLFAGDMDEDGILDLVIGASGIANGDGAGTVINRGVGDGTFEFLSLSAPMTTPWQLAVGDLNGDGHEDVATADGRLRSSRNTVSMLLGDGEGALESVQSYSENINRPFAIDLGDLDGDADLDVVVSNYTGDWEVLKNDGTGQVTLSQSVNATRAASCALLLDVDADDDLDLVLIDEEQDEIVVMQQ